MINKAVFSYWNPDGFNNSSGYSCFKDMVASTALAVCSAKKIFKEVEFITNDFGKLIFGDFIHLPVTIRTDLNKHDNLNKRWWGFTKIEAYASQDKPFVHIDNDAYLWNKPSDDLLTAKLLFQSIETPFKDGYGWYPQLLKVLKGTDFIPKQILDNPVDMAFNCGVMGANDLDIIKEWYNLSKQFVTADHDDFLKKEENMGIHQNLLHEQYFISSLCKQRGYKPNKEVKFLLRTEKLMEDCYREQTKFTHLWGTTKRIQENMDKVYKRFYNDHPKVARNLKFVP